MNQQQEFLYEQDYTIDGSLAESIVNIQDLSVNYNDTLYAYCPKLQKQFQWIGVCMNCFEDHPNQMKSVKQNGTMTQIAGSGQYVMIDIFNFSKALKLKLNSELNKIFSYCEEQQQTLSEAFETKIKEIKEKQDIVLQEKIDNSLAQFCKLKQLHQTPEQKIFFVECQEGKIEWNGYCTLCRKNQKHLVSIYFKPSGVLTYFYVPFIKSQNQPQTMNTDQSSDYRLIDGLKFKQTIIKYLFNKVFEIFFHKSIKLLQNQTTSLLELNKEVNIKHQQIANIQQKLDQKEIQILSFENILNDHKDVNQKLQVEFEELISAANKFEESEMYDIQINCTNLSDLSDGIGWKVKKNEIYEQRKNENCSIVSFYGLFNKGKSFLASKLSGKPISTGYSIQTIGLSALYPRDLSRENSIIFLDTAGLETPINHLKKDAFYERLSQQYKESDILHSKIYEAKLMDRLLTENLIENFVLNESHLILIIVNQLSKEEQKLIKKVNSKYQQNQIIIVHNFNKLTHLEEVKKYIEIDILNSVENIDSQFRKLGNNLSGYVYIQERLTHNEQTPEAIVHLVMANENSEAGQFYNKFCYKYLENRMISIYQQKRFDIIQSLVAEVDKELMNLFKLNSEQKREQYKIQYDSNTNAITANLENTPLKSISFNMLGDMQLQDETDAPKYSYRLTDQNLLLEIEFTGKFSILKEDQEERFKKLICSCELSGCSLLEWHGFQDNQDQTIKLRAQYHGPDSPLLMMPPDFNGYSEAKRQNKFQLIVHVSPMYCILKSSRPSLSFQSGIGRLKFQIQKNKNIGLLFYKLNVYQFKIINLNYQQVY